jgi:UDP-glucose 4-epimerase
MENILVTGGSGFFGGLLKNRLLNDGFKCVSIDLQSDFDNHTNLRSIQGDICNKYLLEKTIKENNFYAIFHCAAMLAHEVKDKKKLWESNVDGTKNIADLASKYNIAKVVFTSSNCLWGKAFDRPVLEDDIPSPVEIYGRSKVEGEKIFQNSSYNTNNIIIRCPTIIDSGRLGLLSILFEFIDENRKIWTVGGGKNRYQFIYAQDLIDACIKSLEYNKSDIFNIGSDNIKTIREIYEYVIKKSNSNSKVKSIFKTPAIAAMKFAHAMRMSPLGPYQYKMIAENFIFDTSKIKKFLKWKPTLTNEEMLYKAYKFYKENKNKFSNQPDVAAHKKPAKMGIIKLLKWIS